jgi:hypothetical protein
MIAASDTGLVPMRVSKAVGLMDGDKLFRVPGAGRTGRGSPPGDRCRPGRGLRPRRQSPGLAVAWGWWIARSSDALNIAVLTNASVFVAPEMLADCIDRQEGDSAEAALLQRAIVAGPMAVRRADR